MYVMFATNAHKEGVVWPLVAISLAMFKTQKFCL